MIKFLVLFLVFIVSSLPLGISAELVCLKVKQKKNGKIKTKIKTVEGEECPNKFTLVVNTSALVGPAGVQGSKGDPGNDGVAGVTGSTGATGAQGAKGDTGSMGAAGSIGATGAMGRDGLDSAWGDGSAGDLVIASTQTFSSDNPQFDNITINSGQTLMVASGTILRCKGDFVNNGSIVVKTSASSGYNVLGLSGVSADVMDIPNAVAHPGISRSSATIGMISTGSTDAGGGFGGFGMAEDSSAAYALTRPSLYGGGAGAAIHFDSGGFPISNGGGSFAVNCEGSITNNNGTISANGADASSTGDGGGGGGVVILASKGTVVAGSISVKGGNGGAASTSEAPGGGGGGGLIHILAPTITDSTGTRTVSGGTGGTDVVASTISNAIRAGGSGGGGSIGAGGWGSFVNADGSSGNFLTAGNGGAGLYLKRTVTNPTGLL